VRASSASARALRGGALLCVVVAAILSFSATGASSATALGPDKTAWYDTTGLQQYTGETTPSLASNGEMEVAYVPVGVTVPKEDVPPLPVTPPTLPSLPVQVPVPSVGSVGGQTLGDTLAFAAVDYPVNLMAGTPQAIDPTSIRGRLTLTLNAHTSVGLATGDILACPAGSTLWSGGDDQDSGQAPTYDCSAGVAVTGNYDASSHSMTFDLSSVQEYVAPSGNELGIFSLVLAPGSSPSGPFTAVFESPGATSFKVDHESLATNVNTDESGTTLESSGAYSPGQFSTPSSDLGGLSNVPFPAFTGAASALPPVSTPLTPSTTPTTAPAVALGTPASAVTGLSSGSQRSIAVILLAALAVGLWMAASNSTRKPKSLRVLHSVAAGSG